MNTPSLAFIIDDPQQLNWQKDTSIALMQAADQRGWNHCYTTPSQIHMIDGQPCANWSNLDHTPYISAPLSTFDAIFMRLEPPIDNNYLYISQMLSMLEPHTLIINRPRALRDYNEKLAVHYFREFAPPTCISNQTQQHLNFLATHQHIVIKPLNYFGGHNIQFLRAEHDTHARHALLEATGHDRQFIQSQKFIPAITHGDKRIFIINGKPIDHCVIRIPGENGLGNIAQGATAKLGLLSEYERHVAHCLGPWLLQQGILFAGIDMIGEYLTEINITCPTLVREVKQLGGPDLSQIILDVVAQTLSEQPLLGNKRQKKDAYHKAT